MLYFARWKAAAILVTALIACAAAALNAVPLDKVKKWPAWAQFYIVLGLDLQGGAHILLEVDTADVRKQRLETLRFERAYFGHGPSILTGADQRVRAFLTRRQLMSARATGQP